MSQPTKERMASEQARKLVANHETVAMAYRTLGASELGDAEEAVLRYIAALEGQLATLREKVEAVAHWTVEDVVRCADAEQIFVDRSAVLALLSEAK